MFNKRKKLLDNQKILMDQIAQTNALLQSLVQNMATNQEEQSKVTVHNLRVDHASLDKLVFQLDSIDINDLSGTLNLGNNFEWDRREKSKQKSYNVSSHLTPKATSKAQDAKPVDESVREIAATVDGMPMRTTASGYKVQTDRA